MHDNHDQHERVQLVTASEGGAGENASNRLDPGVQVQAGNTDRGNADRAGIPIRAVLREAWQKTDGFKTTAFMALLWMQLVAIGLLAASFGAGVLLGGPLDSRTTQVTVHVIAQLSWAFIMVPIGVGLMGMAVQHVSGGQAVSSRAVFSHFGAAVPLCGLYLLTTLFTYAGLVVLIVPGIYFVVAYTFAGVVLVDKRVGVWRAMEASRKAVGARWFSFFGLIVLLVLIIVVSCIPLGLGLFWTMPLALNALAIVYRDVFGVDALLGRPRDRFA